MSAAQYDQYPPTYAPVDYADRNKPEDVRVDVRALNRTPSPTPSEVVALNPSQKKKRPGLLALLNPETFKDKKEVVRLLITAVIIALVVLFIVYQQKIVVWLRPAADWMRKTPGGWLIPIAIMIVISFPPLFGHEIVAILCGDVWGVWIGFGIVAAGTIFGEVINYYVFKWFCMARGRKMEEKKLQYALLAEVVRRGGFLMAIIIRYSAIPGHFSTAVFASCGMDVFTFLGAALLSLPTQLATVYLGAAQANGEADKKTKTIKTVVIIVTIAVTIVAMQYIKRQTQSVAPEVVYSRRKARQAKLRAEAGLAPSDPELGEEGAALLGGGAGARAPVQTLELDGVTLQVPRPQRAGTAYANGHGYAPAGAGAGGRHPDAFTSPAPYPGGAPYGSGGL